MTKKLLIIPVILFSIVSFSQTIITGKVSDSKTNEPIPGASITIIGTTIGTSTDFEGNFKLETTKNPPFNINASSVGFNKESKSITSSTEQVSFKLHEGTILDEVVVSASRTPERIFESPVTIERMGIKEIQNTSSVSYYDGLENLKGVDVNTSSLTFKSINTRGFAAFSNTRFLQLVDGMDNASPALNFPVGNLLGISELDIQGVELLPGASSALYGANAFNGILFMNSKNPFDHEGVSAYFKTGVTIQEANGTNEFVDAGVRVAKKFSDKFAAKATLSFLEGTDWAATDYKQYDDQGAGMPDLITANPKGPEFDRANIYGDEVTTELDFDQIAADNGIVAPPGTFGEYTVSRTGYKETDLTDYKAKSFKADIGLFYHPTGGDLEISYNGKFGTGNTVYQGANRYYLKNFIMQQHKLEVRNNHFFWRAYLTAEDAGDSYDMFFTGVNMNKGNAPLWYQKYAGDYIAAIAGGAGMVSHKEAHEIARESADAALTPQPGTLEFEELLEKTISNGDLNTGSKFIDKSKIYHSDVNYNFKDKISFAEIQLGGSARNYHLNSSGTVFTDADGPINYQELGAYVQGQKWLVEEKLKLTASVRYDKAQNFDGFFSPRVSFVYNADKDKKHNFRISYQTGFRNPTTQDQYIGLNLGQAILVGSAKDNLDKTLPGTHLTGRDAYENSYTITSLYDFLQSGDPSKLVKAVVPLVKPEQVTAFEIGYRGIAHKLIIDFSTYFNIYKDFIGNKTVAAFNNQANPMEGVQIFQTYTNSVADINSYGAAIGLSTKVFGNYDLGFNYTWAKFDFDQSSDPDYEAGFNTPEHKVKVSFGNSNIGHNFGFRLDARWNDAYLWESTFIDAILPARTTVDAQVTYAIPKIKSLIKIGAANLLAHEYQSAPGAGTIGSQVYASFTIRAF